MKTLLALFILFTSIAFSQGGGTIKGKVTDKETGEPLPFVKVVVTSGEQQFMAQTDFDGVYKINALAPGTYKVEARFVGMEKIIVEEVIVQADRITLLEHKMSSVTRCFCVCSFGSDYKKYKNPAVP